jgi:hypothetical protein
MDIHQARKRVLSLLVKIWGAFIPGILGFLAISAAIGCVNWSYKALKNCSALSSSFASCWCYSLLLLQRFSGILLSGFESSSEEESEGSEGGSPTLHLGGLLPLLPFPPLLPISVLFRDGGRVVAIAVLKVHDDGSHRFGSCIALVNNWVSMGCLLAILSIIV